MSDPDLPAEPPRHLGRAAPDAVWAQVRDDYLAGLSAPACCRRYGIGLTALRKRARAEGWRRLDQPWPPTTRDPCDEGAILEESVDGNLDSIDLFQLSFVAHRRMVRAIRRGDGADALRWSRVQRVVDDQDAEIDRLIAQERTISRATGRPRLPADAPAAAGSDAATEAHDAHDAHGVFGVRLDDDPA